MRSLQAGVLMVDQGSVPRIYEEGVIGKRGLGKTTGSQGRWPVPQHLVRSRVLGRGHGGGRLRGREPFAGYGGVQRGAGVQLPKSRAKSPWS